MWQFVSGLIGQVSVVRGQLSVARKPAPGGEAKEALQAMHFV
jgi:hypothetical protein